MSLMLMRRWARWMRSARTRMDIGWMWHLAKQVNEQRQGHRLEWSQTCRLSRVPINMFGEDQDLDLIRQRARNARPRTLIKGTIQVHSAAVPWPDTTRATVGTVFLRCHEVLCSSTDNRPVESISDDYLCTGDSRTWGVVYDLTRLANNDCRFGSSS